MQLTGTVACLHCTIRGYVIGVMLLNPVAECAQDLLRTGFSLHAQYLVGRSVKSGLGEAFGIAGPRGRGRGGVRARRRRGGGLFRFGGGEGQNTGGLLPRGLFGPRAIVLLLFTLGPEGRYLDLGIGRGRIDLHPRLQRLFLRRVPGRSGRPVFSVFGEVVRGPLGLEAQHDVNERGAA